MKNPKMKLMIDRWLPVFLWGGFIFFLSSRSIPSPSGFFLIDVVFPSLAHLIEFGLLFLLIFRASQKASFSFFLGLLNAFLDEFHQSFVPTRQPSLMDVFFDFLGMVLVWLTLKKLLPKAPLKIKNWAQKLALI